ncbi:MAG: Energy-coupling factor transporter transmembrane protein EcfT [bacterium ADurb.Bin363]|nr:MAG: Energy-coupling factor transporter transmembrane protein EcfT [bacterium ADurb.Bin363]
MEILRHITIGQYIPGNSIIHRLDPRIKIVMLILMIVFLFTIKKFMGYIIFIFFVGFIIALAHISIRFVLRSLKPILFLILLTFILNIFMSPGDTVLWKWSFWEIKKEGLELGIQMSLRIVLLIILSSLLTFTTSPIELTDGIEYLLGPLGIFGFPAHELAMMMTIALRFIPTLMEETEKIIKAQLARGADFQSGGIVKRVKNLIPIFVPLFISAFRRADDLALAMESRCYRGGKYRTRMKELRITVRDFLACCVMFLVVFLVEYVEFFVW